MSSHNPTPLRVGARGSLHGWHVRVAGRLVMGVEIEGETYYWNEFHLIGDSGNTGTLVFEETEHGPEWKLFREFTPTTTMTAREAAAKRVGDTVNLDGTPTRITLVDESRVYHIEGEAPEGVTVGDIAHYFNADTGRRMLVASWTGDEIEFYEGEDVPPALVGQTFGFAAAPQKTGATASPLSGGSAAASSSTGNYIKVVVVLLFIAGFAAVYLWKSRKPARSSSAARTTVVEAPRLVHGAQGRLGLETFTISGSSEVEIARTSGRLRRREYALQSRTNETAFLVPGLTGGKLEWHLLKPVQVREPREPHVAAALRKNARVMEGNKTGTVSELFRASTLSVEGDSRGLSAASTVRYGFLAARSGDLLVARWDEAGIDYHAATPYAEKDVLAAFGRVGASPTR